MAERGIPRNWMPIYTREERFCWKISNFSRYRL